MDFFKNQNGPTPSSAAKPPLPDSKPLLPEKKNILDPESILDDDINNSSMASRRGRPPLSRRNQTNNNESEIQQNRSENFGLSQAPVLPSVPVSVPKQQSIQNDAKASLMNDSIEELKKVFSNQL